MLQPGHGDLLASFDLSNSRFSSGADSIARLEACKPCAVTLKEKIGKISALFGRAARFPYKEKWKILQKARFYGTTTITNRSPGSSSKRMPGRYAQIDPGAISCRVTVKAGEKVHQWPERKCISWRGRGNRGWASGRGSARETVCEVNRQRSMIGAELEQTNEFGVEALR